MTFLRAADRDGQPHAITENMNSLTTFHAVLFATANVSPLT